MYPVLFQLPTPWGPLPIYSYGVAVGVAILLGWHITLHLGTTREKVDVDSLARALLAGVLSGLVGARLLFIIQNPESLSSVAQALRLDLGGLSGWGALFGGGLGVYAWARRARLPVRRLFDVGAVSFALGVVITGLGLFLHGEQQGVALPSHAPSILVWLGSTPQLPSDAMPIHPSALYLALLGLVLSIVVLAVYRRRPFVGAPFVVTLGGYALADLGLEPFRALDGTTLPGGASWTEVLSVIGLACALGLYRRWRISATNEVISGGS